MIHAAYRCLAIAALALLAGCSTSELIRQEANPEYVGKPLKSVMVVAVTSSSPPPGARATRRSTGAHGPASRRGSPLGRARARRQHAARPKQGTPCRPTPRVTSTIAVEGIRKGMTQDELRARFNLPAGTHTTRLAFPLGSRAQLRGMMENGRLVSFEVTLE